MSAFSPRRRRSGVPLGRILVGLSPAILLAGFAATSDATRGVQPASFNSVTIDRGLAFGPASAEASTVSDTTAGEQTDLASLAPKSRATLSAAERADKLAAQASAASDAPEGTAGEHFPDPAASAPANADVVVAHAGATTTVAQPTWPGATAAAGAQTTPAPAPEGASPRRPLTRNGVLAPIPTPRGGTPGPVGQYVPAVPVR